MRKSLFLLSFCILLTGCVYNKQKPQSIYAQSELLPPRNSVENQSTYQNQTQQPLTVQGQQTPPIVLPQQTVLPSHILSTPQVQPSQNNPTPFVQTIVIPQATPYVYPPISAMQQPVQITGQNPILPQNYNSQTFQNQSQVQVAANPFSNPSAVQQIPAVQSTQPVWNSSQNIQTESSSNPLNRLNNSSNNIIPRW